ncbi:MAG: type II toxin-antitoxin system Phd/YefM family antitoxin [Enterobacterales bacterium endosymbiont of Blomia tropicalis]|uniref:type II toxin-antitoxin system Phd/YefM family antitoxin n=1 Tax=Enterobacterales TaxID=91347 RepID=UPI000DD48020|nr:MULTISPECIES: type II toxin-antitoxin system Phd/YefM family antitoxin [Enterobacterales]MDL4916186.1 type II toxin-antitoxin system Phd/YefM family antitoxin [Mixta mediterraneensis]
MPNIIHSNTTASITELKTNPMATVSAGDGYPVAILNRNQPAFYCVPAELYEQMLEYIDDQELAALIKQRSEQALHDVDLDSYL